MTYVYDLSNQLIRVLQGGNQVGEYTFNGAGQRMKKVTQAETRIFHYDSFGHIVAETNQIGQVLAEYVYLGDQLLAMIKPGEAAYYYHNDHLGTPQVLTNESQAVVWKAAYTPFGEAVTSIATVENKFRFPGQYYDPETGLHYNYYRYYNPPIGRYLTPDPIGLEGGINLFSYVGNAPVNKTDPLGLWFDGMDVDTGGLSPNFLECLGKCAADQFGITMILGALGVGTGLPILDAGTKFGGATEGTSIASKYLSKAFPQKLGKIAGKIPAPTWGAPLSGTTATVGRLLGRWVPVVGWGLLAYDAVKIMLCVEDCLKGKCEGAEWEGSSGFALSGGGW